MINEASYWFASWVIGLVALGAVQFSTVCAEPSVLKDNAIVYYVPTMTVTQYQDLMGEFTSSGPALRPVVTD